MNDRLINAPIASPCTGVCQLGSDGLCEGCQRTAAEIGGWLRMSDRERHRLMESVLPLRALRTTG